VKLPILRFIELIRHFLFARKPLAQIHSPPRGRSRPAGRDRPSRQITFSYA
jgi:hypothetical protein